MLWCAVQCTRYTWWLCATRTEVLQPLCCISPCCCCRYVFLVDAQGRLRWRGSGSPSDSEMATLLRCTEELLQQEGAGQQQQQPGGQAAAAAGA